MTKRFFYFILCLFSLVSFASATALEDASVEYGTNTSFSAALPLWDASVGDWRAVANPAYKDSVGWLYATEDMLTAAPALEIWAASLKDKYDYVVVLGMGGSALPVAALKAAADVKKGYPKLIVLDTSNPDTFLKTEKQINLARTLFVVSSKSGTTVETMSAYKYFWYKTEALKAAAAGENFIAVTEAGSPLYKEAQSKNFLRVFENRKDIGGAFVAVSYSSVVPAALAGYDVKEILTAAKEYQVYLKENSFLPSALAKALSGGAAKRVFFVLDKQLEPLGAWIGEVLSETSGKQGLGVAPIITAKIDKKIITPSDIIIYIGAKPKKLNFDCPAFYLKAKGAADIAKQIMLWQFTVLEAAENLGVDPFKQPDSGLSKKMASKIIKEGIVPPDAAYSAAFGVPAEKEIIQALKENSSSADYIALLLYSDQDAKTARAIKKFALKLQSATQKPVIIAFGPSYQHTLGQFFKGGNNKGLFLILSSVKNDLRISPENEDNMKTLILAQAYGDFLALGETGRKAAYINLNLPLEKYLKTLWASL